METSSRGYQYYTTYETEGNEARVSGHFSREQTQAGLAPFTEFSLRFYGQGSGIEIGIRAYPISTDQSFMARARSGTSDAAIVGGVRPEVSDGGGGRTGTLARIRLPGRGIRTTVDPFGHPIAPPEEPPQPPGGVWQAALLVQLFAPGLEEPVQTWNLPSEVTSQLRKLTFTPPPGYPAPDAPIRRRG